ncbi:MAG: prolipoprotein diacylglyceryl transferase [Eubacterium sp.]|nr:prolipoprotein diacylglyceryl transferase [Eubacterium sp.]
MSSFTHVYFDGLGLDFNLPSVAFTVFGYDVHWYGIIIAFGFALAVLYGGRGAYKWKMSLDGMTDVLIWGTVFGIVFARLYYVAFEWEYYSQHLNEIPAIWNGGIAIYGGIIGALIGAAIGCKIGKINFLNLLDLGALGLLIGQGIGRWGNFFNQEAFGTNTDTALFRMWSPKIRDTLMDNMFDLAEKGIDVDPNSAVHPTFLYESVWCLLSFVILHFVTKKFRKFKGETFMLYGVLYGAERMVVEGMRTDSLYIGTSNIRVSQLLSLIILVVSLACFIYFMVRYKKGTLPAKMIPDKPNQLVIPDTDGYSSMIIAVDDEEYEKMMSKKETENADN